MVKANLLTSEKFTDEIDELLLSGRVRSASKAEAMVLDAHLLDLVELIDHLDDEQLRAHDAYILLMFHGSRRWEDAL